MAVSSELERVTAAAEESVGPLLIIGGVPVAEVDGRYYVQSFYKSYGERLAARAGAATWLLYRFRDSIEGRYPLDTDRIRVIATTARRTRWPLAFLPTILRHRTILLYLPVLDFAPQLLLARLFGRRLVVYMANDYLHEADTRDRAGRVVAARLWRWLHAALLRHASGVIARGEFLASLARRHNDRVLITSPLGNVHDIDTRVVDPETRRRRGRLLFIGRLIPKKGLDVLIDAIAALRRAPATAGLVHELVVLGEGADRDALAARAAAVGLGDVVTFEGFVSEPAAVADHIREAAALVVPTTGFPEGVPRVIDEAHTLRVPVVASAIGGVPREFPDGSVDLVPPGDGDALHDALAALLEDAATYASRIAAIEARMSRIAWEDPVEQHFAFLARV